MVKSYFGDLKNLVSDVREGSFDGFSITHEDPRDLAYGLEDGGFSGIDLYGTSFQSEANSGLGDKMASFLKDREVAVFADGRKLGETMVTEADLRIGGSGETIKFTEKFRENIEDVSDNIKNTGYSWDSDSIADLFEGKGIKEISFKPVEKAKETAEKAVSKNDSMTENQKMGIGVLAVPVVIYGLYKVFIR